MAVLVDDSRPVHPSEFSREETPLIINSCQRTPLIVEPCSARAFSREVRECSSAQLKRLPSEDLAPLQAKIRELENKETEVTTLLKHMDNAYAQKRKPVEDQKASIVEEKQVLRAELAMKMEPPSDYPPAPGPVELRFVDSGWFGMICNTVVVLNLLCMGFANKLQAYHSVLYVLDQLFLFWYVLELTVKWKYHRCNLFLGKVVVVWWNWLDAAIVVSGVVDQWLMALVHWLTPFDFSTKSNTSLRAMRLLRLFRVMRFLKVIKTFMHFDHLIEKWAFQIFMSIVIAVNAVVLALELDVAWEGWLWFENMFVMIYSFELSVRLKVFGWRFFVNSEFAFNNLDFVMVCGGVFDLWFIPAWCLVQAEVTGDSATRSITVTSLLKVLRVVRLLRVLRLVRLLKMAKFLHSLFVGISEAMVAMQKVLILTLLVLYAAAIIFTSMIGHGYMYASAADKPPEAEIYFGTVPCSYFSLFKLMNGDTSPLEDITTTAAGQLLFGAFMILSNWAVLAILTSVVSDRMITSSQKVIEEDKAKEEEERLESRARRLKQFFVQVDSDNKPIMTKSMWDDMLTDSDAREELCETTGLDDNVLRTVFSFLSEESASLGEYIAYEEFVAHLNHDKDMANRRQLLQISHLIRDCEKTTVTHIDKLDFGTKRRFENWEGMLEKAMDSVHHTNYQKGRDEVEKNASERIKELESRVHQKFEVFQGMLEKVDSRLEQVMSTVWQKNNHKAPQDPQVPNDMESRIAKLEGTTLQKFEVLENMMDKVSRQQKSEVLENMLEKIMHAVTEIRRM